MDYFVVSLAAFLTAILTFFSGFGLGTLLTPVFLFFFPVELAIALTGVVHFFNNIFKVILIGKHASKMVIVRFGIPAMLAAFLGAWVLTHVSDLSNISSYSLFGNTYYLTPIKLIIAVVLIVFSLLELVPLLKKIQFNESALPVGGIMSGFFGGLSGHQGALRSAFLINLGLSKEAFIGTGVIIACFIDITRLSVYFNRFLVSGLNENFQLVLMATFSAMLGAILGRYLLNKITIELLHNFVAVGLIVIAILLGAGLI